MENPMNNQAVAVWTFFGGMPVLCKAERNAVGGYDCAYPPNTITNRLASEIFPTRLHCLMYMWSKLPNDFEPLTIDSLALMPYVRELWSEILTEKNKGYTSYNVNDGVWMEISGTPTKVVVIGYDVWNNKFEYSVQNGTVKIFHVRPDQLYPTQAECWRAVRQAEIDNFHAIQKQHIDKLAQIDEMTIRSAQ